MRKVIAGINMTLDGFCDHTSMNADDELHRLAVSISGLGVHLFVSRDVIEAIAPQLSASHEAVDLWGERLVMYAEAMIDAEDKRRKKALKQQAGGANIARRMRKTS